MINSLLLIAIFMLPGFFSKSSYLVQLCVALIVDVLLCFYLFYQLNNANAFSRQNQEPHWKYLAILAPTIIALLSLPFTFLIDPEDSFYTLIIFEMEDGALVFFLQTLEIILLTLIDEMLFRMIFFNMFRIQNRGLKIIASAGVFALFGILYIFSTFSIESTLIYIVQCFMLGLILGAIVEYGHCVYFSIVFALIFNFVIDNMCLFIFPTFSLNYTLIKFLCLGLADIYVVVMYFVYFRKKEYDYVQ